MPFPAQHHKLPLSPVLRRLLFRRVPDHLLSPWTKFMVGAGGQAHGGPENADEHGAERQPTGSPVEPLWALRKDPWTDPSAGKRN